MLSERLFGHLDRARLDRTLTRRALHGAAPIVRDLVGGHTRFRAGGPTASLASGAQRLVDHFCEEFVVGSKPVELLDQPRPHRRRGGRIVFELHGQCRRDGAIQVYVRTAAQRRPIAIKSLLETLLHEFVHHYDFDCFGAPVHCSGFYERLGQLYRPLREQVDRHAQASP
jgi:hypothetical protein